MIRYEHPLNERIRTLMRLEDLFRRALHFAAKQEPPDHHAALLAFFEIIEVASRADLKSDLLQELERQRQLLVGWRDNPVIAQDTLLDLISEIEHVNAQLLSYPGKVGQHIRDNEWLSSVKQRAAIPGGMCEFDLPTYHYWLNSDTAQRQRDLAGWLDPLLPIRSGLAIILRMLRDSGKSTRHTAYQGIFQVMLTTSKVAQLIRVMFSRDLPCIPEISANKYALNIRFVDPIKSSEGSKVFEGDVEFELTFCNL